MPLAPGVHVGAYEITGILGAGGMGEVYRATDKNLDRQVAVKIVVIQNFREELRRLVPTN
jgi:serine/threonine protein kinase